MQHEKYVYNTLTKHSKSAFMLNVDDYHNLHDTRNPDVTSISQLSHMATILINNSKIPPVPAFTLYHPSIYNPQKLDLIYLRNH